MSKVWIAFSNWNKSSDNVDKYNYQMIPSCVTFITDQDDFLKTKSNISTGATKVKYLKIWFDTFWKNVPGFSHRIWLDREDGWVRWYILDISLGRIQVIDLGERKRWVIPCPFDKNHAALQASFSV